MKDLQGHSTRAPAQAIATTTSTTMKTSPHTTSAMEAKRRPLYYYSAPPMGSLGRLGHQNVRQEEEEEDDEDSENMIQPPPHHPLLEAHLELEHDGATHSRDQLDDLLDEGEDEDDEEDEENHEQLHDYEDDDDGRLHDFDDIATLEEARRKRSISIDDMEAECDGLHLSEEACKANLINYSKKKNKSKNKSKNPQQSINNPTDGIGNRRCSNGSSGTSSTSSSSTRNSNSNSNIIHQHNQRPAFELLDEDNNSRTSITSLTSNHQINSNHHHQSQAASRRPNVAASSPIQVPARRTRKDFYSMKLNMMKVEESANAINGFDETSNTTTTTTDSALSTEPEVEVEPEDEEEEDEEHFSPVRRGDRNRPPIENMPAFDDDDAFLDREFNENHYNHYLLDGLDDEHLTAEEDPMRLFASIQALAKSLHEDAELFGSLPPKRMLESPIRSIAFA